MQISREARSQVVKRKANNPERQESEQQFLARYDAARFPHPSLAVDVAVLTADQGRLKAVLVRRNEHPDLGKWSLPGGFVHLHESLEQSANRALESKAALRGIFLEQLYTFGEPDRDPRTRVITVAYYALTDINRLTHNWRPSPDVILAPLRVPWSGEKGGAVGAEDERGKRLPLAFDHGQILGLAIKRLRGKLNYAPIGFELLPRHFTLRDLQTIHETILDRRLNKDSFRRRMLASGLIAPTGEREADVGHRPAELFRFKRRPES
jgi:8-oxo-dGTP diphosphatase